MIIKKCYIENFGKLSKKTIELNRGINILMEDNGWGKTTLMTFIKAMFYGLEYKQGSKSVYERNKYEPWGGGNYGGYLIFEEKGIEYRITRYFGKKAAEDTFEIINENTGMLVKEYTDKVGEQLLEVDKESFERSIFIVLKESNAFKATPNISAKLNNLIENPYDISNYDEAIKKLEEQSSALKKRGGSGEITRKEEQINDIKEKITKCKAADKKKEEVERKREDYGEKLGDIKKKIDTIDEKIKAFDKFRDVNEWKSLRKREKAAREKYEEGHKYFSRRMTTAEELSSLNGECNELRAFERDLHNLAYSEEDRRRLVDIREAYTEKLDNDYLEDIINTSRQISMQKARLEGKRLTEEQDRKRLQLEGVFQRPELAINEAAIGNAKANYISMRDIELEINKLEGNITVANAERENLRAEAGPKNKLIYMAIMIVVSAMLVGIIGANPYGIGLALAADIAIVIFVLCHKNKPREERLKQLDEELSQLAAQLQESDIRKQKLKKSLMDIVTVYTMSEDMEGANIYEMLERMEQDYRTYEQLKERYEEYVNCLKDADLETKERRLETFIEKYRQITKGNTAEEIANSLIEMAKEEKALEHKDKCFREIMEAVERLRKKINEFLGDFPFAVGSDNSEKILFLQNRLSENNINEGNYKQIVEELKNFEEDKDVYELTSLAENAAEDEVQVNIGQLQSERRALENAYSEWSNLDNNNKKEIADLEDIIDGQSDLENNLEQAKEELAELKNRLDIIKKAMEYLEQAKNNLSERYIKDMKAAFEGYVSKLNLDAKLKLTIDMETKIEENGKLWNKEYFSEGYGDVIEICQRLALVDAMYKDVENFIILDDPFTNLDNDKLQQMRQIIKDVSSRRQIIYCTCHDSRML